MFTRILAATDLSDGSSEALRQARAYACSPGGLLAICYVAPPLLEVNVPSLQPDAASAVRVAEFDARVRELIDAQTASCALEADVEVFVDDGRPYAAIVRRSDTWLADLIVVGNHGMSATLRMDIGSVAVQVVRNANCPVLVARTTADRGVVVAATDFSDASLPATAAGVNEAQRRGARLLAVHVVEFESLAMSLEEALRVGIAHPHSWNIDEDVHRGFEDRLRDALRWCGGVGEVRVLQGTPSAAVVRCADEVRAELVVVGTRGRTGLARLALGSVAERIIRSAACSVLAVRIAG
jgi:nucleotide-binding universal stress UspA family protein